MKSKESRKWWVLGALSFCLLAVGFDLTILNVALPTLSIELQASTSNLQWFANSYNLVLAAVLLPAGMLGDRFGRKKMLLGALVLFGLASAGCAYSDSAEMLIVMRAILGIGAAFLIPLSMSVLPVLFEGTERTKAMMMWAVANMLGIPLGPILGGWLLKHYWWGSVFLVNIPLIIIGLIAVATLMPESRSSSARPIDLSGIVLSSFGLTSVTFGIIRGGEQGWGDNITIVALIVGFFILTGFVMWQRRARHPLIDLSLFRSSHFTWGSILATLVSFALFGLLFVMPLFFQAVAGNDAFRTGLNLLPLIGGLIVGARAANMLLPKIGAKYNAALGFAFIAAGLFIGTATSVNSNYGYAAMWFAVTGLGLGLALPTTMDAALGALSAERSGVGSALIMAMRQVGGAIGIAILGAVLNSSYRYRLDLSGLSDSAAEAVKQSVSSGVAVAKKAGSQELLISVQGAFVHGMEMMLWVCGGIAVVGILLTLTFLPRQTAGHEVKESVGV